MLCKLGSLLLLTILANRTWALDRAGSVRRRGCFGKRAMSSPPIGPHETAQSPAFRIIEDRQNNLWVFTSEGLFRVVATRLEMVAFKLNAATAYSDSDGILWLGRKGDGLVRFKDRPIQMIDSPDADGRRTIPTTVLSDREGGFGLGTRVAAFRGLKTANLDLRRKGWPT